MRQFVPDESVKFPDDLTTLSGSHRQITDILDSYISSKLWYVIEDKIPGYVYSEYYYD